MHVYSSNMRSSYPTVTSSLLTSVRIPIFSLLYAEEAVEPSVSSCKSRHEHYPEQSSSRTPHFRFHFLLSRIGPTAYRRRSNLRRPLRSFWNSPFLTRSDGRATVNPFQSHIFIILSFLSLGWSGYIYVCRSICLLLLATDIAVDCQGIPPE